MRDDYCLACRTWNVFALFHPLLCPCECNSFDALDISHSCWELEPFCKYTFFPPSYTFSLCSISVAILKTYLFHIFFREPDPPWLPHHWYGSTTEGGWKDQDRHHAVCRQWKPRPRDLLVQGHASRGHQQQQRADQTASLRYNLIWSDLISWRCYSTWHMERVNYSSGKLQGKRWH